MVIPCRSVATDLDISRLETLSEEEIARTLRMSTTDLANVARTIAASPRSTIEPVGLPAGDTGGERAVRDLVAESAHAGGILSGLDVEKTLGEGGMGIVRIATQRSLGRKVAVKTLKPAARNHETTLRLLREAWVTGTLEHPNIVPVYDLGLDESGAPIIVLKRIEGREWSETIREASLETNLRILVSLCNAVGLAHARGILHRDLKPENVMIGAFGEVYLVDWGIAVSLRPDPTGRMPLAAHANEMAGTPCYMAPEMLGAMGTLSERTDIYLLGAVLHEILTGAPPHSGSFQKIVGSILLSRPTYDANVPRELAVIAQKAMARDAANRFASVDELRARIEWYVGHRGSLAISAEAEKRLAQMRGQSDSDALYRLFTECRFGFRQALDASRDNVAAREGLREAIEIIVRFELARGGAEAAAGALAELESPPSELVAAVADAQAARAEARAKMERLEAEAAQLDPAVGRRTRLVVAGLLGISWIILPLLAPLYFDHSGHPWWELEAMSMLLLAIATLGVLWGRVSLLGTVVNRRIVATGLVMFGAQIGMSLGMGHMHIPFESSVTLHLIVWAMSTSWLAMMNDRRFWICTGAYFACFLFASMHPAHIWHAMSAGNVVLTAVILRAWARPSEDLNAFYTRRAR